MRAFHTYIVLALASYLAAWLLSFVALVGFKPSLVGEYFALGWSFSGFEIATSVWLGAWPIFALVFVALLLLMRRNPFSRKRAV
jgi:hypothetical protein